MPGSTSWLHTPLRNSSIDEYEKYKHLKYVKTGADKNKFRKIKLKIFQGVFFDFIIYQKGNTETELSLIWNNYTTIQFDVLLPFMFFSTINIFLWISFRYFDDYK